MFESFKKREQGRYEEYIEATPAGYMLWDENTDNFTNMMLGCKRSLAHIQKKHPDHIHVIMIIHTCLHDYDRTDVDRNRLIVWDCGAGLDSVCTKHTQGSYTMTYFDHYHTPYNRGSREQSKWKPSSYHFLPSADYVPDDTILIPLTDNYRSTHRSHDTTTLTCIITPSLINTMIPLMHISRESGITLCFLTTTELLPSSFPQEILSLLYHTSLIWVMSDRKNEKEQTKHRTTLLDHFGFGGRAIHPQWDMIRSYDYRDMYLQAWNHENIIHTLANHEVWSNEIKKRLRE